MTRSLSILLVEDSPDDEELIALALERGHIQNPLVIRRDGQSALDYLLDPTNELPVLVLLDVMLPKLSGLEVLLRMREAPRTLLVPVVMLTSSDDLEDRRFSYEHGANSFVTKPIATKEFMEAVKRVGLYWAVLNKPPWEVR